MSYPPLHPESVAALGPKRVPTVVFATLGILLGLLSLVVSFAVR